MSNSESQPTDDEKNQLESLDRLVDELSKQLIQVPEVVARMIQKSIQQQAANSLHFPPVSYFLIGNIYLKWQLYINRRKSKTIFFFFRKNIFDNSLITHINYTITPTSQLPTQVPFNVNYQWVPPAFISLSTDSKKAISLKSKNELLISVGEDSKYLIKITFAKKLLASSFQITQTPNDLSLQRHPKTNVRKVQIVRYLQILKNIQRWLQNKTQASIDIDLSKNNQQVHNILQVLSDGFVESNVALIKKQSQQMKQHPRSVQQVIPYYLIRDYQADIKLRLDRQEALFTESIEENKLAAMNSQEQEKFDLFQILVQLNGRWKEDRPIVQFKIFPADFLMSGELYNKFLQAIDNKRIAKQLDISHKRLTNIINSIGEGGFIFRIKKRGNIDTQMFVLPFEKKEEKKYLIFTARFRVNTKKNKIKLKKKIINESNNTYFSNEDIVLYFLQMLHQVNKWKNRIL